MLLRSLATAATLWFVARFVLDSNLLAWPLAIFVADLVPSALFLLQNHRVDLRVNAAVEILIVLAVCAFVAVPRDETIPPALFNPS